MMSTGHCRFNLTEEMSSFYDMKSFSIYQSAEERSHPDDQTLRLPSGKLLAHRAYVDPMPKSRSRKEANDLHTAPPEATTTLRENEADTQALAKKSRQDRTLTRQFANLSMSDQMSLKHLPQSQQRSLLLAHKKELDKAKRAATRKERRLEQSANKIAVHCNYYKQEVPVYMGG
jgi:pre-60S factor REI1